MANGRETAPRAVEREVLAAVERAFAPEHLRLGGYRGLRLEEVVLAGEHPDTEVAVIFRHHDHPGHRFGYRHPVWGADVQIDVDAIGGDRPGLIAQMLWILLLERIEAIDMGLPHAAPSPEIRWVDGRGEWPRTPSTKADK